MKFVTSLAFKYIKRQKLRSVLTFTSITLAVFIMNIFFVFFGTIQRSFKNYEIESSGSWEANLSNLFSCDENIAEKYEKISSNPVIDDSYISVDLFVLPTQDAYDRYSGSIPFFSYEIKDSKNNMISYDVIVCQMTSGNSEIYIDPYQDDKQKLQQSPHDNEIILPSEYRDLGYTENDMITLTVTPAIRTVSFRSAAVSKIINSGTDPSDPYFFSTAKNKLIQEYGKENLKFDTEEYGNEVTETFKIAGFKNTYSNLYSKAFSITTPLSDSDFISDICKENSSLIEADKNFKCAAVRIKDELSFSDSMDKLVSDLGYSEGYYSLLDEDSFHTDLLAYELKDFYGLTSLVILIVIIIVIITLCWFLSRFIIDNAFEISAQERNAQFAILRIIGSSKKQITAFTFTEAAFYSVTAIPAGTLISVLFSYIAFSTLKKYLTCIELYINPLLTAAGILLCILAVFISSYTSALYGSRKKSLSETYYNSVLSDEVKTGKEKKTRSSSSSKIFIFKYTIKNILRTKNRFIISSAALVTGTVMLTFSGIFSAAYYKDSALMRHDLSKQPDFLIYTYSEKDKTLTEDHLRNNPLFSDFYSITEVQLSMNKQDKSTVEEILKNNKVSSFSESVAAVDEKTYNIFLNDITDISYSGLSSSSQGVFFIQGSENKCTELDKPLSLNIYGTSVEINRIVTSKNRIPECSSLIIVPEKAVKKAVNENRTAANYTIVMCRISETGRYSEAKNYIKNNINPDSYADLFIESSGQEAILFAIIRLAAILLGIIWLTGILSMANSVNSSVLNREYELIMMRSVGMSMKQLRNTVITESLVFSSFSTVTGLIAGIILFAIVYTAPVTDAVLSIAGILAAVIALNSVISVIAALPGIHNLKNKLKV